MSTSSGTARAHRGGVYALLTVATVITLLGILAIWVQRQALDGDNWTASSSRLLEDPAIRSAVSDYLVDELYANVDVAGEIRSRLPDQAKGLSGAAAGAVRNVAPNIADEALQRPRVQAAWEKANREAHAQLMRVLNGGGDVVSTSGGTVTLDLTALLTEIDNRIGVGGRLADKIPASAANLVILKSNQLKAAQDVTSAIRPLAIGITTLGLLLFAAAVWLAGGWRRRALRSVGVGLITAGIAALLLRRVAGNQLVDALASTASVKPAIAAAWDIETSLLVSIAQATIGYGAVVVFGAWLAGPTRAAIATRRALAPYVREPVWAYGGLAVVVVLLLAWAPTQALRQVVTAVLLIAFLVAGFEVLRRQIVREFPEGDRQLGVQLRAAFAQLGSGRGRNGAAQPGEATTVAATAPGMATAAPAAGAPPDKLGQLERLADLYERGVLTDEELAAEKRAIRETAVPVGDAAGRPAP